MMRRTATEGKVLAERIRLKLGERIIAACMNTCVPPRLLAGLISVENIRMDPNAMRFERYVYNRLKSVRNKWKFWARGYKGVTQQQLAGASDEMLVDFATSFCYTQIMGWHVINELKHTDGSQATITELRDPDQHLHFAVQLLNSEALIYFAPFRWDVILRIWNTGLPNGKTFDPNYVENALAVLRAY